MNKLFASLGIGLIIIAGIAYLLLTPERVAAPERDKSDTTRQQPVQDKQQKGEYKDFKTSIIAGTKGIKVLFFHASWCPQCRELENDILSSEIPPGLTIFKVDYDTNQDLREKYGVTLQTTLVSVDDKGNLIEKYVAYSTPSLEALIENLL